jgi:hypothetical protein
MFGYRSGRHDDQVDSIGQFLSWHFSGMSKGVQLVQLLGV